MSESPRQISTRTWEQAQADGSLTKYLMLAYEAFRTIGPCTTSEAGAYLDQRYGFQRSPKNPREISHASLVSRATSDLRDEWGVLEKKGTRKCRVLNKVVTLWGLTTAPPAERKLVVARLPFQLLSALLRLKQKGDAEEQAAVDAAVDILKRKKAL